MGRILSQDEIDALLGSSPSSEATSRVPGGHDAIVTYDFRRPDRASREQIRSLHVLHDRFARNMSTSLSAYLRATSTFLNGDTRRHALSLATLFSM